MDTGSVATAAAVAVALRQAIDAYGAGQLDLSLERCRWVLGIDASHVDALFLSGLIATETAQFENALPPLERAVRLRPRHAGLLNCLGYVLRALGRSGDALAVLERALAEDADLVDVHHNRGLALHDLERFEEALASFERALRADPTLVAVWTGHGNTLAASGRAEDALQSYRRARELDPDDADTLYNLGLTLRDLRRLDEAIECFDRTLVLRPDDADALSSRAVTLVDLGRHDEALHAFQHAAAAAPNHAETQYNFAHVLRDLGRIDHARAAYERATVLDPTLPFLAGCRLHARLRLCDWRDFRAQVHSIEAGLDAGRAVAAPWDAMAVVDTPSRLRQAAQTWVTATVPPGIALAPLRARRRRDRLRVGYYSADFYEHAVSVLAADLFERHDRTRFETVAFNLGPVRSDAMRTRLVAAFDNFHDVHTRTDREIAQLSRDLEIDIAVDLMGHTRHARPGVFVQRAAPVQASYLGFAGSTALPSMDYVIADDVVLPQTDSLQCSEQVIRLPRTYLVNDRARPIAARPVRRDALGLPPDSVVFCCFNAPYKVGPEVFDTWMNVLDGVKGSVLWLLVDGETPMANLHREARSRGVDPARLVFAPRVPSMADHLARMRAADLFLDTWPYNAHSTVCDALWAGVPVLTKLGHSFAGRVAASALHSVGLSDLVTRSRPAYQSMAVQLASQRERLHELRGHLDRHRLDVPLFDTALTARHLETAYEQAVERHDAGLAAKQIRVPG